MPVIINDFEVVVDQPPAQGPGGSQPQPAPPPALRPEDIERIRRHYVQRMRRVHAD